MSVSTLVEKLYSKDKAARMLAIRSLGQIGAGAATAIPDLVELVDDADKDISSLSLRALALIGPNNCLKPKLVETLSGILVRGCGKWRHLPLVQWEMTDEMLFHFLHLC